MADLYNAFSQISNDLIENKIPIVFWDEFDCDFDKQPYGWLKYFLAPMEDGKYFNNNSVYKTGKAIYIFAGSLDSSWDDFVKPNKDSKKRQEEEKSKKADFISRIDKYMDVTGLDYKTITSIFKNTKTWPITEKPINALKRAVMIRKMIERHYGLKKDTPFDIKESIIIALLRVEKFKNGTRSLDKLIGRMKDLSKDEGNNIKYCNIPAYELDLYIEDSEKFRDRCMKNIKVFREKPPGTE